jgi:hypothetical protein
MGDVDWHVRVDVDRALRVLDRCLLLLLVSNVWCVLTIEHFPGLSGVFVSVRMANTLLVEAVTAT